MCKERKEKVRSCSYSRAKMLEKSPRNFLWWWHTFLIWCCDLLQKKSCVRVLGWKYTHWYGVWCAPVLLLEVKGIFSMSPFASVTLKRLVWKLGDPLFKKCVPPWKTILCFGLESPEDARLHSSFLSPSGDRVSWLSSTESWPDRGHKSARLLAIVWGGVNPSECPRESSAQNGWRYLLCHQCLGQAQGGFLLPRVSLLLLYWDEFLCEKKK